VVDLKFLPKALHDIGKEKMTAAIQKAIDEIDLADYDALLLGYGLCNNGVTGLTAPVKMVIPRVHDCIALFFGDRTRYETYFAANPGTYYESTGWIERCGGIIASQYSLHNKVYQEYVELYGEENAEYLIETLGGWEANYDTLAYIDTQVGDFCGYKQATKDKAQEKGWRYDEIDGDCGYFDRLLAGNWDDREFLVVDVGNTISGTIDGKVLEEVKWK
jgi:hypothetical protein